MRVTASQSSVHRDIVLPAEESLARADYSPDAMTPDVVKRLLGVPAVAGATILNQFRSAVTLNGLNRASPQPLSGEFVKLVDNDFPRIAPPEEADPPGDFTYDAPSREFAAVNAYHHCDGLFRRLQEMGFDVASYFDGTSFPVPVDACAFGDDLNARAPGNQMGLGRGQVRAFHND
jgi:zinc metalloprotease ZmpB